MASQNGANAIKTFLLNSNLGSMKRCVCLKNPFPYNVPIELKNVPDQYWTTPQGIPVINTGIWYSLVLTTIFVVQQLLYDLVIRPEASVRKPFTVEVNLVR
jgi:hypothetical protein